MSRHPTHGTLGSRVQPSVDIDRPPLVRFRSTDYAPSPVERIQKGSRWTSLTTRLAGVTSFASSVERWSRPSSVSSDVPTPTPRWHRRALPRAWPPTSTFQSAHRKLQVQREPSLRLRPARALQHQSAPWPRRQTRLARAIACRAQHPARADRALRPQSATPPALRVRIPTVRWFRQAVLPQSQIPE
jgi:hypothetical protein